MNTNHLSERPAPKSGLRLLAPSALVACLLAALVPAASADRSKETHTRGSVDGRAAQPDLIAQARGAIADHAQPTREPTLKELKQIVAP